MGTDHTYRYVNATNVYNKGKADGSTIHVKYYNVEDSSQWHTSSQYIEYNLGAKPKNILILSQEGNYNDPNRITFSNGSKWGSMLSGYFTNTRITSYLTSLPYSLGSYGTKGDESTLSTQTKFDITNTGFKFISSYSWRVIFAFYTT